MKRVELIFFLGILLFSCSVYAASTDVRIDTNKNLFVVWEEFDNNDSEIYVREREFGKWKDSVKVTENETADFSPCVALDKKGNPWVVWVGSDGVSTAIYSRYWEGENWSKVYQVDSVDTFSDTLPSITFGLDNTPWVVWCGTDGKDDDIYISSWSGSGWRDEEMINVDDRSPDVAPAIRAVGEEGEMLVTWAGYNGRKYELYYALYKEGKISDEKAFSLSGFSTGGECPSILASSSQDIKVFWFARSEYYCINGDGVNWEYGGSIDVKYEDKFINELLVQNKPIWVVWSESGVMQNFRILPYEKIDLLAKKESMTNNLLAFISDFIDPVVYADGGQTKYIAFGDSITNGRDLEGYPPKLESKLNAGIGSSVVYNEGVSGERTMTGLERIDSVLASHQAKYILIMEGTNDITFGYSSHTLKFNLGEMIDKSKNLSTSPFLATLIPRNDSLDDRTKYGHNDAIRELAEEKGVPLVEQYWPLDGLRDTHFEDSKHPNEAGYEVVATQWYNAIYAKINPDSGDGGGGCGAVTFPIVRDNGNGINLGIIFVLVFFLLCYSKRLKLSAN